MRSDIGFLATNQSSWTLAPKLGNIRIMEFLQGSGLKNLKTA
jgi:hypothetical protein